MVSRAVPPVILNFPQENAKYLQRLLPEKRKVFGNQLVKKSAISITAQPGNPPSSDYAYGFPKDFSARTGKTGRLAT